MKAKGFKISIMCIECGSTNTYITYVDGYEDNVDTGFECQIECGNCGNSSILTDNL